MIYDDMPRKYLLMECREDINKIILCNKTFFGKERGLCKVNEY